MNNKQITRRSFLKILGGVVLSSLLLPLSKTLPSFSDTNKKNLKEAKYYKSNDSLLG